MSDTTTYYRTNKGKRRHRNWTCANGRRSIHQGDVIEIPAAEVADWLACRFCCSADDAAKTPAHVRADDVKAFADECPNTGVDKPKQIVAKCNDCGKKGSPLNGRLRKHRRPGAPKTTAAPAPVEIVEQIETPAAVEPVKVSADTQARLNSIIPAADLNPAPVVEPAADNRVAPAPVESPEFMRQVEAMTPATNAHRFAKVDDGVWMNRETGVRIVRLTGGYDVQIPVHADIVNGKTWPIGNGGWRSVISLPCSTTTQARTIASSALLRMRERIAVEHAEALTMNADIRAIVLDDEAPTDREEITIGVRELATVRTGDIIIGIDGRRGGLHHTVTATLHSEHPNAIGFTTPSGLTGNLYADSLVTESVTVLRALPVKVRYRRIDRVSAAHVVAGDRLIVERDERYGWLPTRRVLAVIATATEDSRKDGNGYRRIPTDVGDIRVSGSTFFGIAADGPIPAKPVREALAPIVEQPSTLVQYNIRKALHRLPYVSARVVSDSRIRENSPEHAEMLRQGWVNPAGFLTLKGQGARHSVMMNLPLRFKR